MIDDLRAMAIFAETIKHGSFRQAANTLNLSPSVVSYHISQLEQRLNCALIYRSTRKISLTHEGEKLFSYANQMLTAAQTGLNAVTLSNAMPYGKLTINLPMLLTYSPLLVVFANFAKTYPFIELNLQFNDSRPNIIEQGIDLAVRLGDLADSNLKAKKIGIIKRKLVCSTDFYNQQSPPVEPSELVDWQWLHLQMLPTYRRLQHPKLGIYDIHYETQLTVDSVDAITQLCLLGLGLATPPLFLIEQALKEKKLIEVLPQWQVDSIPMYAVWPENQISNNLTQLLLNYLAQHNTELIEH